MHPIYHALAVRLIVASSLGAASMTLFGAAVGRVDLRLVPVSARARVHWLRTHIVQLLAIDCAVALIGLVLLGIE